jgi:hypothetical protein
MSCVSRLQARTRLAPASAVINLQNGGLSKRYTGLVARQGEGRKVVDHPAFVRKSYRTRVGVFDKSHAAHIKTARDAATNVQDCQSLS